MNDKVVILCLGSAKGFETQTVNPHQAGMFFGWWLRDMCLELIEEIEEESYSVVRGKLFEVEVELVWNRTSVNSARVALRDYLYHMGEVNLKRMLIVHDDLDLPFGKIVFSDTGSSARHKGVRGIQEELKSKSSPRLRIGITPEREIELPGFLTTPLTDEDLGEMEVNFTKALEILKMWLGQIQKEDRVRTEITRENRRLVGLMTENRPELEKLMAALNHSGRVFQAQCPPAACVISEEVHNRAREFSLLCFKLIKRWYEQMKVLRSIPGNHEMLALFEGLIPIDVLEMAFAQPMIEPTHFNIDLHAGREDSLDPSLVEFNVAVGAPEDVGVIEKFVIDNHFLDGTNLKLANRNLEHQGVAAIAHYCVLPFTGGNKERVIAVVNSLNGSKVGNDGHNESLVEYLNGLGFPAELCSAEELVYDKEKQPKGLVLNGRVVSVIWMRTDLVGKIEELRQTKIVEAVSKRLVWLQPAPGLFLFNAKYWLAWLNDPQIRKLLGVSDTEARVLDRMVPYSDLIDADNYTAIKFLIESGVPLAIKPVKGGGSRGVFVYTGGSRQRANETLNRALARSGSDNPYVVQGFAPRFEVLGTEYECDLRVILFADRGEPVVKMEARLYRSGEDALVASVPVIVLQGKTKAKHAFICPECTRGVGQGYPNEFCPTCSRECRECGEQIQAETPRCKCNGNGPSPKKVVLVKV